MTALHDMHCHLDFITNASGVAADACAAGSLLFANTVNPEAWEDAHAAFADFDNVTVGFGLHPWWVAGGSQEQLPEEGEGMSQRARHRALAPKLDDAQAQRQLARTLELLDAHEPLIIGEIGLDFGWRHQPTRELQIAAFSALASWAGRQGGRLLSIHAIKSAGLALDILEEAGALESCDCIFHWFSGTSEQLKRAVQAGCYFSCGPRMFATGKGREYAKAIPASQLLLETDAPPEQGTPYSYAELRTGLESAARSIAGIKGEACLATIAQTSERLLSRR